MKDLVSTATHAAAAPEAQPPAAPPGRQQFESLQLGRAVLGFIVALYHLSGVVALDKYFGLKAMSGFMEYGPGVEGFLVLSGFIILWLHSRDFGNPRRAPSYVWKRFARIYPAYWLIFLAVYGAALAIPSVRDTVPQEPLAVLKALLLLPQDPAVVGGTGAPVLVVAWTLQYEIAFYALVALFILGRPLGLAALALFTVNFVTCKVGTCSFPRSFFANDLFVAFACGAMAAWVCASRFLVLKRPLWLASIALALVLASTLLEAVRGPEVLPFSRPIHYGVLCAVLMVGLVRAELAGQLNLRTRLGTLLGDASYSIYLLHFPLISLFCKLAVAAGFRGPVAGAVLMPVFLLATTTCGILFHKYVERPLVDYLRQREWFRPPRRREGGATSARTPATTAVLPGEAERRPASPLA